MNFVLLTFDVVVLEVGVASDHVKNHGRRKKQQVGIDQMTLVDYSRGLLSQAVVAVGWLGVGSTVLGDQVVLHGVVLLNQVVEHEVVL